MENIIGVVLFVGLVGFIIYQMVKDKVKSAKIDKQVNEMNAQIKTMQEKVATLLRQK